MIDDEDLRRNHDFVSAFESLRKRFGFREMSDAALREIAVAAGASFEFLRTCRHIRNAIAHAEPVNRGARDRYQEDLRRLAGADAATASVLPTEDSGPDRRAWRVHAWKDERLEQEILARGFVSIGGEEIGDLTSVTDPEEIRAILTESMPERTRTAVGLFVAFWRRFLWDAQNGDVVALPLRNRHVAIGSFVGRYRFVEPVDAHVRHRRAVSWDATDVPRDRFAGDLLRTINGHHTVQEFKAPGAARRLTALAETGNDPGP